MNEWVCVYYVYIYYSGYSVCIHGLKQLHVLVMCVCVVAIQ